MHFFSKLHFVTCYKNCLLFMMHHCFSCKYVNNCNYLRLNVILLKVNKSLIFISFVLKILIAICIHLSCIEFLSAFISVMYTFIFI